MSSSKVVSAIVGAGIAILSAVATYRIRRSKTSKPTGSSKALPPKEGEKF